MHAKTSIIVSAVALVGLAGAASAQSNSGVQRQPAVQVGATNLAAPAPSLNQTVPCQVNGVRVVDGGIGLVCFTANGRPAHFLAAFSASVSPQSFSLVAVLAEGAVEALAEGDAPTTLLVTIRQPDGETRSLCEHLAGHVETAASANCMQATMIGIDAN